MKRIAITAAGLLIFALFSYWLMQDLFSTTESKSGASWSDAVVEVAKACAALFGLVTAIVNLRIILRK